MSKFNLRGVLRTGTSPVATADHATGTTYEGAPGFGRDPKSELFLLAVTSLVSEDTFYEAAAERDARLRELVARVAVADYDWTFGLVGWLRKGVHLRSVALVVAAEAVRARLAAGLAGGNRALVSAALDRADEPGEFLAYWASRYGRRFPQPVKRGVADAAVRLYSERSLVKYDGDGRAFRFADVLELTHAAPKDARQSALFRYALDRRHDRADAVPAELGVLRARERLLQASLGSVPSLAVRAASADLVEFGTDSRRLRVRRGESGLSLAERMDALGGTKTADAVRRHFRRHDRVVIVTDEQAWGGWYGEDPTAAVPPEVPVYTFNLAGYRYGHGPSGVGNRHTFGCLSDQGFAAIPLLEAGRDPGEGQCA